MKIFFTLLAAILCYANVLFAQNVGINTDGSAPDGSAMLDVKSSTKGFLVPRMLSTERTAINPAATGLLVYQTDAPAGFYYYTGSAWTLLGTGSGNGTVTSVATGTGLTGGPVTTTGTISLANTSVTAGSYTRATITVDAQGRITAAGNGEAVNLTSGVSGTLPVANGGTGTTTGSITGTGALTFAAGGSNQNVNITPSGVGYTMLGGNVGIGGTAHSGYKLYITDATTTSGQMSLYINKSNSTASANGYGIQSNVNLSGASSNSYAIVGNAGGTATNYAITGNSNNTATNNIGVLGTASGGTSINYGVRGSVSGTTGANNYAGFFSNTSAITSNKYGSYGEANGGNSGHNFGVYGKANSSTNYNYGVYGTASGSAGTYSYGGYFENVTTTNNSKFGAYGVASGVSAADNWGIYGLASGSTHQNTGCVGIANVATTGTNIGGSFYAGGGAANYAIVTNGGNVGFGTLTPAYQLDVAGDVNLTGVLRVNGAAGTAGQYLKSNGASDPTWADVAATTATTATNLAGGSAGTIPYQSAAGTTAQLAAGTSGYILKSNGAAAPSWLSTVPVANGGTGSTAATVAGGVLYGSSTSAMASTAAGTSGQVLTSNGTSAPSWSSTASIGVAPVGSIMIWAGSTAPTGWLLCDGTAYSTGTYPALYAVIGTTYGTGIGFMVPNLKGKIPVGLNSADASFNILGETGGEKTHTISTAELPAHNHSVDPPSTTTSETGEHRHSFSDTFNSSEVSDDASDRTVGSDSKTSETDYTSYTGDHTHTLDISSFTSGSAGSGTAMNVLQPYIVLNYIIKY